MYNSKDKKEMIDFIENNGMLTGSDPMQWKESECFFCWDSGSFFVSNHGEFFNLETAEEAIENFTKYAIENNLTITFE
tara:strand:+ start:2170 stop:2403 length:234 start_codon:yes stop_codon:yes gene_type:complete